MKKSKADSAVGSMISLIHISYATSKECKNEEAWFTCYKCGKCGRIFDSGFLIDEGGTTPEEDDV